VFFYEEPNGSGFHVVTRHNDVVGVVRNAMCGLIYWVNLVAGARNHRETQMSILDLSLLMIPQLIDDKTNSIRGVDPPRLRRSHDRCPRNAGARDCRRRGAMTLGLGHLGCC